MTLLDGRVAVITGAKLLDGQVGIGGATARAVVREGGKVLLLNRTLQTAQALADELNNSAGARVAIARAVDLSVPEEIPPAVALVMEEFGRVDMLVNNAAVTGSRINDAATLDVDVAQWDNVYALNVRAPFLVIKSVLPFMLADGGGSIINVSSTASLAGDFVRTAYGSSKAALNMLSLYVATQYGRQDVRCNVILPGLTSTGNTRTNMPEATWRLLERQVTRPAPNTAEDLANVAVFLGSSAGAGINGEVIRVDGGFLGHAPYAMDLHDLLSGAAVENAGATNAPTS